MVLLPFDNGIVHPRLINKAVEFFIVNVYLKDILNLPNGVNTSVSSLMIDEYLDLTV